MNEQSLESHPPARQFAGACDTHIHIYDPRFAARPGGLLPTIPATVADYEAVMRRLGLDRCIVVQPSAYAFDNSCTEAAIAAMGQDRARGVAMIRPDIADAELQRLDQAGFRGARFHVGWGGDELWADLAALAPRLADLGWQASVQFNGRALREHFARLNTLPCPLVIEHAGNFDPVATTDEQAFRLLLRLIDNRHTWVKVSGPYGVSRTGPPDYADFSALATALIAHAPERMIWASDWPHPSVRTALPDDRDLLDLLHRWAPDPGIRKRVLADNAAALFGFD
ncbi:amidohydrolase family protein [soil metagenome]